MRKQVTINNKIEIRGISAYSGEDARIVIDRAKVDTGIEFVYRGNTIKANINNLASEKNHTTSLAIDGIKIQTIEHLLSALRGLQIDNVRIVLYGDGQVPVIQGTALDYVAPLMGAGLMTQTKRIDPIEIPSEIRFSKGDSWAVLKPQMSDYHFRDCLTLTVEIEFPEPIGEQRYTFALGFDDYIGDLVWARSFIRSDISKVWPDGETTWEKARETIGMLPDDPRFSDVICFDKGKWVTPIYTPNEPARHKMVDLIGDLALAGKPIVGEIFVHYPGHKFNCQLAKEVIDLCS